VPILCLALPVLSFLSPGDTALPRPFAAQAIEILSPLVSATINVPCDDPDVAIRFTHPDDGKTYCFKYDARTTLVRRFARQSLSRWLQARGLPAEDAEVVRNYARVDLQADVAAHFALELLAVIQKPEPERTQEERELVTALNYYVNWLEWGLYEHANAELSSFLADQCHYKPDVTIATVYGFSYDGSPYCYPNPLLTAFRFHIPGPSYEYLYALGFSKSWGSAGSGLVPTMMGDKLHTHLTGLAALGGGAIAGAAVQANIKSLASKLVDVEEFPNLPKGTKTITLPDGTKVVRVFGRAARFLAGGAFSIVTMMVEIGVEAIMQFQEEQKLQDGYARMKAKRGSGGSVSSLLEDQQGMQKFFLLANFFSPSDSQEAPLPRHRAGVDRIFLIAINGATPRPAPELTYTDREGIPWNVRTWKNWFLREGQVEEKRISSITPEIEIKDWEGVWWLATRFGDSGFRMTQIAAPKEASSCPAVNGESLRKDRTCAVYFSKQIRMTGPNSERMLVNLGLEPTVEELKLYFPSNVSSRFNVQITGEPRPAIRIVSKPAWLQFTGDGFIGNPGAAVGSVAVELEASSVSGRDHARFIINFGPPVKFITPTTMDITAGVPFEFPIRATAEPAPKITKTGWLPSYMRLVENADGTATIRGIWNGPGRDLCYGPTCDSPTVTATNRNESVAQRLTFNHHLAPLAEYTGPGSIEFLAGIPGRFVLTTRGATTRVDWNLLRSGLSNLPWLRQIVERDGSLILSGTPPVDSPRATLVLDACPYAEFSGISSCLVGNLKLHIIPTPRFTTLPIAYTVVGQPRPIPIGVNRWSGTISFSTNPTEQNRVPRGLSIVSLSPASDGSIRASLSGNPEPGQGGRYEFTLNWSDGYENASQRFVLDVLERPTITSPPSFTFFEGMPSSGEVTTQGYPINAFFAKCGDVPCGDMRVTFRWMDARRIDQLRMVDRSVVEFATGFGRFEGAIPTGSAGIYPIEVIASNGKWAPEFQQRANVVVLPTPDLNADGRVDCQDIQAIKNAIGTTPRSPGTGYDLNGDAFVDDKDVDAMARAVSTLRTCAVL
jgi:hypothetical protein